MFIFNQIALRKDGMDVEADTNIEYERRSVPRF